MPVRHATQDITLLSKTGSTFRFSRNLTSTKSLKALLKGPSPIIWAYSNQKVDKDITKHDNMGSDSIDIFAGGKISTSQLNRNAVLIAHGAIMISAWFGFGSVGMFVSHMSYLFDNLFFPLMPLSVIIFNDLLIFHV